MPATQTYSANALDWATSRHPNTPAPHLRLVPPPVDPYAEADLAYRLPPVRVGGVPLPPVHRLDFWAPTSEDVPVLLSIGVASAAVAAYAMGRGLWRAWNRGR